MTVAAPALSQRRRLLAADGLAVLVWVSAAFSLFLYLASGLVELGTPGEAITTLGIAAGLVASDLVLVMLVLASRAPLIDRIVGHDRAMGLHRRLGKPAFYLLLAHGVLLTIGYALTIDSDVVTQTLSFLSGTDMLLAYLATGLFVAVIVTSLVAVRRRLPYEFWHVVHLLSYLAVLGALPHMLSEGQLLSNGTWQRGYWIALYALAFGSVGVFRFLLPAIASIRHGIRVERVERVGPDAFSVHLRGREMARLAARGGQYFIWRFWTGRDWWHAHPVSLSASPHGDTARITLRGVGRGTRSLAELTPGTRVSFSGPFGLFTDAVLDARHVAIAAAGIGITPVRALLERLRVGRGRVTVLVRASSDDEIYLWRELDAIRRERGIDLYTSIGPRAGSGSGWLSRQDAARGVSMRSVFPELAESDLFICGPDAWAQLVEDEARQRGVPAARIHREKFDW